jgi:hypothetical protein
VKWKWDLRPDEFKALPPADQKRVWLRCYWPALRRPRVWGPLVLAGAIIGPGVHLLLWLIVGRPGFVLSALCFMVAIALLSVGFSRYMAAVLREELRRICMTYCLVCWYDLTGNESGTCPECGTPRRARRASGEPGDIGRDGAAA